MNARLLIIAAVGLAVATGVAAEPSQESREAPQASAQSPRLLLASADRAQSPTPADQPTTSAPKRPRVARVTSCRCGDPQVQPDQQQ